MTRRAWTLLLRAGLRRPGRLAACVVMALVMAITTHACLLAGDALSRLFTEDAEAEWGLVDVEARSSRTSVFDDSVGRLIGVEAGALSPRWAPRLVLPAVASRAERSDPQVQVLGLGAEDQSFPRPVALSGSADWLGLGQQGALVNQRLARRLGLAVGDTMTLTVAVPEWRERVVSRDTTIRHLATTVQLQLLVAGVLADTGTADLHRTSNVIVNRDVLQRRTGLTPAKSTVLHLSARTHSEDDAKALVDHVNATALGVGMSLRPVRTQALETAEGEGGLFRSILLSLALLVTVAAAAGLVNLLTALGLERARELALLRSMGLTDRDCSRLLVAEGLAGGLVAALLGAAVAVPTSSVLATALSDHFASLSADRGREQVALATGASPGTVLLGVALMLVVVGLAARSAARRVVRADLDAVLRGEQVGLLRVRDARRPFLVFSLSTFVLGAGLASGGDGALLFLGITLLLAAGWLHRRRQSGDSTRLDRRAAQAGLVWSVVGAAVLGDFSQGVQAGFGVITLAGQLALVCACVLASERLRQVMRQVRGLAPAGPVQAALLTAGANAQQRRDRSGLAMGTVAAALFTVTSLAVLGNVAGQPAVRQGGGFDVLATTVADARTDQLRRLPEAAAVIGLPSAVQPEERFRVEDDDGTRMTVPYPVRLIGASPQLVAAQGFRLAAALPGYTRASEALQAVVLDDDKAVLDRYSRPEGAQPGDDVVLDTPAGPRRFTLVAVLDTFLLNGVFLSDTSIRAVAPTRGDTLVLARSAQGSSSADLALALERSDRGVGLDARTVDEARADVIAVNRTFTDVFAVMVFLALLVALVSLAVGVVRSERERRAEIGLFRALGASRRHAVALLAAEPVLTATVGAAIGTGVGLALLRVLFWVGYSDLPFLLDGRKLGIGVAAVEVLALVTCVLAAWLVTRRPLELALADRG